MVRIGKFAAAATLALGGILAAASPAMAGGDLVDIKVGDVVIHDAIDIDVAAALCGITTNVLSNDLNDGDNEAACPVLSPAKVYKH